MAYNILIVDDSATTRSIIARTLEIIPGMELGDIYQAGNGQEALKELDRRWVDIVFADINMPVMDGVTMVEKMAEHPDMKKIPVVIVSTEGSDTRMEQLFRKGVRAYIRKPFSVEKVSEILSEILGEQDDI
ncbi:response regulator [bacterium]|nr:response regulator [bacterium]MBU1937827.1 response regulator [bacterium]